MPIYYLYILMGNDIVDTIRKHEPEFARQSYESAHSLNTSDRPLAEKLGQKYGASEDDIAEEYKLIAEHSRSVISLGDSCICKKAWYKAMKEHLIVTDSCLDVWILRNVYGNGYVETYFKRSSSERISQEVEKIFEARKSHFTGSKVFEARQDSYTAVLELGEMLKISKHDTDFFERMKDKSLVP